MARPAVSDRDLGYRKVVGRLLGLGNLGITVGVHEGEDSDIATRAIVNEFGSDDGHVPERSFLRSTIDSHQRAYARELAKGVDALIDGALCEFLRHVLRYAVRAEVKQATIRPPGTFRDADLLHHVVVVLMNLIALLFNTIPPSRRRT